MSAVREGDVIAGKFRVERVIGEGGMGYVVAAEHLQLGRKVALKFMRDEVMTPDYRSRFFREARNTVRLKSKHVSRVLDVGALDSGTPYIVMEYLEGIDLSELLQRRGPLPVPEVCEYLIQACEAIYEAHSYGIVHRDLKPANLFLTRGASGEALVKVLDFGVSKVLDLEATDEEEEDERTSPGGRPNPRRNPPESVVTKATDLLGSPSYMAPEQVVSARDADAKSDIWSLGVILFRLVSGKAPFGGTSLGEVIQAIMQRPLPNLRDARPDIPPGLEDVVARCIERDRNRRMGDVMTLARMLAPYAGPTITPSLERIAILGDALVHAAAPMPPEYSNSGMRPWTSAPSARSLEAQNRRRDISFASAVTSGILFFIVVLCGVLAVAMFLRGRTPPSVSGASSAIGTVPPVLPPASAEPNVFPSASASASARRRQPPWRAAPKGGDVPPIRP